MKFIKFVGPFVAGKNVALYSGDGESVVAIAETVGGKRLGKKTFRDLESATDWAGNEPGRVANAVEFVTDGRVVIRGGKLALE